MCLLISARLDCGGRVGSSGVERTRVDERLRDVHAKRRIEHLLSRARWLEQQQCRTRLTAPGVVARAGACAAEWQREVDESGRVLDEVLCEAENDIVACELQQRAIRASVDVIARGRATREGEESTAIEWDQSVEALRLLADDDPSLGERLEELRRQQARVDGR